MPELVLDLETKKSFDEASVLTREQAERKRRIDERMIEFAELRKKLLEQLPQREDGINTKRIKGFLVEFQIPLEDYRFLEDRDVPAFKELCKTYHFRDSIIQSFPWWGLSMPEVGLVIINRSLSEEESNTAVASEGILGHELVHGMSAYADCIVTPHEPPKFARIGFGMGKFEGPHGWFLEEGTTELVRDRYTQRYMPADILEKVQAAERGFYKSYDIPAKYLFLHQEKEGLSKSGIYSSLAGYGMEMLCERKSELFSALLKARTTIENLRKVPQILNEVRPGLYTQLRNLAYSETDFLKGLALVKEICAGNT